MSFRPRWCLASGLGVLLAASTGCRDSSSPPETVVVSVSTPATATHAIVEQPSGPQLSCSPEFVAEAQGRGTAKGTLATFRWFFGLDRTTPVQSEDVPIDEVAAAFGVERIAGGETQRAGWEFMANAPFEVEATFRYRRDGSQAVQSTTTRFACGTVPPAGGVAGPQVTELALVSPTSEVEFGDSITVTYTAVSPYALWKTTVLITGAFTAQKVISERMVTTSARTIKFVVPSSARMDVPISITVLAVDGAMREHSRTVQAQTRIVDRTPPRLIAFDVNDLPLAGPYAVAGQYAVGELFRLNVIAHDNHEVAWMVYELGAPANVRDSVQAPPGTAAYAFPAHLPVRPEWIGAPTLTFYVRDAGGRRTETFTSTPESIRFYPTVARPTTAEVPLSLIGDVAYDAKRGLVYIGQPQLNQVAVLATATMTLETPITLPSAPAGMDLSLSGDSLIVAMPERRALAIVNLAQRSAPPTSLAITVLETEGALPRPSGVRVAANGMALVMLTHSTASGDQAIAVNFRTGVQQIRTDARNAWTNGGGWVDRMERTQDRSRITLLGACARSYLAVSDQFTACADAPSSSRVNPTFDAAGTRLTFGRFVLDSELRIVQTAPTNGAETPMALAPDGLVAWLNRPGGISAMRVSDGVLLERVPLSFFADRLFMEPGGNWLLAFRNFAGSSVVRIDLR